MRKDIIKNGLWGIFVFLLLSVILSFFIPHPFLAQVRGILSSWIFPAESALLFKLLFYRIAKIFSPSINQSVGIVVIPGAYLILTLIKQIVTYIVLGVLIGWVFRRFGKSPENKVK